jgi:multiple sugar transport system substrate-binding protein
MFYNKDLLDAAGIAYPSATEPMTVDQYAELARALTVQSDNFDERVWGSNARGFWFLDFRNYFSEDLRTVDGYVNDEATVHALQVMADIVDDGSVISNTDAGQFAGDDLLISGKLATTITDNAYAVPLLENTDIRWGASVPPVEQAGDPPHADQWTDGLGVPSGSDTPDEAALFVAFWGREGSRLRMEVTGDLPLNLAMAEEMGWAGDSEGRQDVVDAVSVSTPRVFVPIFGDVFESIEEAFYVYMLEDGMSAEDSLAEVLPIVQENLDAAWETWDSLQAN